jgi:hypothetical protein
MFSVVNIAIGQHFDWLEYMYTTQDLTSVQKHLESIFFSCVFLSQRTSEIRATVPRGQRNADKSRANQLKE